MEYRNLHVNIIQELYVDINNIDCIILRYFNTYGPRQTFTPYVGVLTIL